MLLAQILLLAYLTTIAGNAWQMSSRVRRSTDCDSIKVPRDCSDPTRMRCSGSNDDCNRQHFCCKSEEDDKHCCFDKLSSITGTKSKQEETPKPEKKKTTPEPEPGINTTIDDSQDTNTTIDNSQDTNTTIEDSQYSTEPPINETESETEKTNSTAQITAPKNSTVKSIWNWWQGRR